VHDVVFAAGEKVIDAQYVVTFRQQLLAEMGPQKAGTASDGDTLRAKDAFHARTRLCSWHYTVAKPLGHADEVTLVAVLDTAAASLGARAKRGPRVGHG
jgi:hypothetical protein